jgi:hypothetical protein
MLVLVGMMSREEETNISKSKLLSNVRILHLLRPIINVNRGRGVSESFLEDGTDLGPQVRKLGTLGIFV